MATEAHLKEHRIAVFFDFENIITGVRDAKYDQFRLDLILDRLVEKGKIVFKRAYCDWSRFREHKNEMHENSFELVDIPKKRISGKNSADIRMVVDALDLCFRREHVTAFALVSGDSDFSPLATKLTEYNKYVIGIGVKNSTSELLVSVSDEFIYYEDLVREKRRPSRPVVPVAASASASASTAAPTDGKADELFDLVTDAYAALQRENYEHIWGSMIKQQIKRKRPQFSENYFGFRNFSDVLEAAKKAGLFELKRDQRSGSYVVTETGRGGPPSAGPVDAAPPPAPNSGGDAMRAVPQFGD
jgi:uncharacterized LabA/DUF88 family protein